MQISKSTITDALRDSGAHALAVLADSELPDPVDTERDAALLRMLGAHPGALWAPTSHPRRRTAPPKTEDD